MVKQLIKAKAQINLQTEVNMIIFVALWSQGKMERCTNKFNASYFLLRYFQSSMAVCDLNKNYWAKAIPFVIGATNMLLLGPPSCHMKLGHRCGKMPEGCKLPCGTRAQATINM